MTQIVDLVLEDARWEECDLEALAEMATKATLAHLGLSGEFEVNLLACDDARIAELNSEFRGKGGATNVLSWPSQERGAQDEGARPDPPEQEPHYAEMGIANELGDIAISYDTCAREAVSEGKSFGSHVVHLMAHGLLHLLGYDHIREKDAVLMEQTEREILETLGISDPYKMTAEGGLDNN